MSSEEVLDVVDENDSLIGKTITLGEAHKNNVPHRLAAVLVFRPNGKLLMQAHKNYDRKLDHSVGGHVMTGETYKQAAAREMEEELGLEVPIEKVAEGVVSKELYPDKDKQFTHIFGVYKAQAPDGWSHAETEEVDQLVEDTVENIVSGMNQNPDNYLQGFMATLGAYLDSINSPLKIKAYGKDWTKL